MAKILLDKWMSYHKCPHCDSTDTYHSHAMENLDTDFGNVFGIEVRKNHFNSNDITVVKNDLCLECGRQWATHIQRVDTEGEEAELKFKNPKNDEVVSKL